jgi:hypothetical protein
MDVSARFARLLAGHIQNCCVALLTSLLLVGCIGTSAKLNHVSLGMTKAEVIRAVGTPDSISAKGNMEYLVYLWGNPKELIGQPKEYFIRLKDGRVDSYGEKGDFGSTKDPTVNLNIQKQ